MPGFDIQDFSSQLNAGNGVLRNNKYLVTIPQAQALVGTTQGQQASLLQFWADSASIPAAALATADIRRYGYGAVEKKPFAPLFTDVNLTFICDGNAETWNFFYNWISLVCNFRWATTQSGDAGGGIQDVTGVIPNQHPYELAYKTDYIADAHIQVYDPTGQLQMEIVLREAYPIFLGDLPLNWASTDAYIKIPVTLTFFDWYPVFSTATGGTQTAIGTGGNFNIGS